MRSVVVVTGASRGIGAAIARLAATRGYAVCVHYRTQREAAGAVVDDIRARGGEAIAIAAEMGDSDAIERMFAEVDQTLGPASALVNNAGMVGGKCRVDEMTPEFFARVTGANLGGCFYASREAIRRMSTAKGGTGGCIVNISSMASVLGGLERTVHYAAIKGAIDAMTVGLAREVAKEGIRVNAIRPGIIDTDIHIPKGGAAFVAGVVASGAIPLGRAGLPEEVARAALWLLSEESSYVTGAILNVSGGR